MPATRVSRELGATDNSRWPARWRITYTGFDSISATAVPQTGHIARSVDESALVEITSSTNVLLRQV
jgi:hypothetical protein